MFWGLERVAAVCRYLWRPEEGTRYSEAGVTGGWKSFGMSSKLRSSARIEHTFNY